MDFERIAKDTSKNVAEQVKFILDLNISPADKQARIARLVILVGESYHEQTYAAVATALDSTAIASAGLENPDAQAQRLSQKIVRNYALSREVDPLVGAYYDSVLGSAQDEAFRNAVSMGRNPTMTRTLVGETCSWCRNLAGTHRNPSGELFARHERCDCLIVVSGYNTRNGLVTNFRKARQ